METADAPCPSLAQLEATDVSFMFPLPAMGAQPSLLLASEAQGEYGLLLPRAVADAVGPLGDGTVSDEYTRRYVMAVRFDPCARAACEPEVRLVVQLLSSCSTACDVRDGALHLFYAIDRDRVSALARDLRTLKALAPASAGNQLAPHPVIAMQGLDGAYATMLKQIVLRYAGAARLTRIARMKNQAAGMAWDFELFTRDAAGLQRQTIPRIDAGLQEVLPDLSPTISKLALDPAPADEPLARLLDSTQWAAATEQQWTDTIGASLRVENPLLTTVDDVDCATCHVTGRARTRALAARPLDVAALPTRFDPGQMISGDKSDASEAALMAFGYLRRAPTVTDRVLNDSIVSARQLDEVPVEACAF
jgi:hypothetical protein